MGWNRELSKLPLTLYLREPLNCSVRTEHLSVPPPWTVSRSDGPDPCFYSWASDKGDSLRLRATLYERHGSLYAASTLGRDKYARWLIGSDTDWGWADSCLHLTHFATKSPKLPCGGPTVWTSHDHRYHCHQLLPWGDLCFQDWAWGGSGLPSHQDPTAGPPRSHKVYWGLSHSWYQFLLFEATECKVYSEVLFKHTHLVQKWSSGFGFFSPISDHKLSELTTVDWNSGPFLLVEWELGRWIPLEAGHWKVCSYLLQRHKTMHQKGSGTQCSVPPKILGRCPWDTTSVYLPWNVP